MQSFRVKCCEMAGYIVSYAKQGGLGHVHYAKLTCCTCGPHVRRCHVAAICRYKGIWSWIIPHTLQGGVLRNDAWSSCQSKLVQIKKIPDSGIHRLQDSRALLPMLPQYLPRE